MIFDTHAHYDDEAFDDDREQLLERMRNRGVEYIVNVGSSMASCKSTIGLIRRFPYVYGALGVHPDEISELTEEDYKWLGKNIYKPKIVAVGEIGLDYHWDVQPHEVQKYWFVKQMELAKELDLPIAVHSRDAAKDTLDLVKDCMKGGMYGGIIHCFSYGKEMAREYLDMGLYLGIGGVVTFKNAKKLKEVVAYAPLEQLVLETDSPYLSPEPNRGKRNSSLNLPYVAEAIAQIKGCSEEEVIAVTEENAKKLLLRK